LRAGAIDKLQFGAVPDFVIFAFGMSVVFDEVAVMELVQFGDESTSINEYEMEVDVSSFVFAFEIDARTGASLIGLTVSVNVFVSVSAPSVTTTVIFVDPYSFKAGDKERLQFGAVPDLVMLPLGTSVVFDDVTVIEFVQSGVESTSLNEYETVLGVSSFVL
jgi:hypothetical protein